jgi:hypothetical protein
MKEDKEEKKEEKEDSISLSNIVKSVKSFFRYLLKKKWVLVSITIIAAVLGAVYYNVQKPKYEAVCTFILEEKQSGLGNLGNLASQFGLDMGSLTGGSASLFAGDNILDILKSKKIIRNVLLSKVDSSKGKNGEALADLFLDFRNWKRKWSSKEGLKDLNFKNYQPGVPLSLQQDSVLALIHEDILKNGLSAERLNKKGSIIKVLLTVANQHFAKLMTDRMIDESKIFYITIKTNTAQQNVDRLERKADSLLMLLNTKSFEAASAIALDPNPAFRTLAVPAELKTRDKSVLGALYAEVVKNLEISRFSLSQQTPVIQVLDKPEYPLVDQKKSMAFLIVVFAFGGFVLTVLLMGLRFLLLSIAK